MDKMKKTDMKAILSSDKTRVVLVAVALILLLFMFLGSKDSETQEDLSAYNAETYHSVLTQNILDMVKSVKGAGDAKVLLTLENSYEYIYLDDGKTLRKINEPTIRGVVVACDGGDLPTVSARITELLTTVLNIPSTKVCISKLI